MPVSLSQLFTLSPMPPNRRILALNRVRERIESIEAEDVVDLLDAVEMAIKHDEHALALETARLERRSGKSMDQTSLDDRIDRTLGLIYRLLEDYRKETNPEVKDKADELADKLFPDGLHHHINLPYAEQHVANEQVVTHMEAPEHRDFIDEQGLRGLGNRLRSLNASFGALLHAEEAAQTTASWEELRSERRLGHERLLQVVARIVGKFPNDDEGDVREELLQPILEQEEALHSARRRHDTSSDMS